MSLKESITDLISHTEGLTPELGNIYKYFVPERIKFHVKEEFKGYWNNFYPFRVSYFKEHLPPIIQDSFHFKGFR